MDNTRNFSFRIKSCAACNESQCPVIKERLDQHMLSHHSTFRPSVSSQHARKSSITYTSPVPSRTPSVIMVNSDEQTSVAELVVEEQRPFRKPNYREVLEREIVIWADDLLKYPNPSAISLKQNIVKELIEKVNRLKLENEEFCDIKLSHEISKFLDSLPPNPYLKKRDSSFGSLKLKLINKICELNKETISRKGNINNFVREYENRTKSAVKNNVMNTTKFNNNYIRENKTSDDSYLRNNQIKTIGTNTSQCAFNDKYVAFNRPESQHKNSDDKKLDDAQIQHNFYNIPPYYGKTYRRSDFKNIKQQINEDTCKEKISTWLTGVIQKCDINVEQNDIKVLTDVLFNRLRPLLTKKINYSSRYKLLLKGEILNFLHDYFMVAVTNNGVYIYKFVENLAISLLTEKANSEALQSRNNTKYSYHCTDHRIENYIDTDCYYKPIFYKIVTDALENVITHPKNIEIDITDILLRNIDLIRLGFQEQIKEDLHVILKSSTDLYDTTTTDIVNIIMDQLKYVLCDSIADDYSSTQKVKTPPWSHILTVYKSEVELSPPKFSNRSLQRYSDIIKRSEPKLNTEERAYKECISALISSWVKSLPKKLNKAEDKIIKETIINSLALDIMDQVKLEAAAPETWSEKEKYLSFFIYRWLNRFQYFDDINNAKPFVDKLMKKLIDIPLPAHSSHQKKNINKFMKMKLCSQATLTHDDIIEDELAIIIDAQPSKIFINTDKEIRNQRVHELALGIQKVNDSAKDIRKEIIKWLTKVINPEEKEKFNSLKKQLTERISILLKEKNSRYNDQDRILYGSKDVQKENVTSVCCESYTDNTYETEKVFKEFIAKYVEHYNDVDNTIAREVFGEILKIELHKLSDRTSKAVYDNFTENEQYVIPTPNSLSRELKYITVISDWLNILPIPTSFNRIGNRHRIEFVNCLAKNLNDINESRITRLTKMEYKVYLASIINKYADQLPVPTYHKKSMSTMVDNLVQRVVNVSPSLCCQIANCKKNILSLISSTNMTNEQLIRFFEEYIRENCVELSEDELKLEALSTRLFNEIGKMRTENPALSTADEAKEHLSKDELVRRLSFELIYAKEITECLNNLPLLPITDKTSRYSRVKMISNLAKQMYERWQALQDDPNNTFVNTILSEYIIQWISELSLDTNKEIDEFTIIQQLLNRMDRVNERKLERREIRQPYQEKSSSEICKFPHKCCNKTNASYRKQDPGDAIVETIENWCAELPVQIENENTNTALKNYVATNIFKKVSELNMNPKCLTDNNLYREFLSEKIDEQLGNLPQNVKLQKTKESLKQQLVSSIMEKIIEIRKQASSTEYKQDLEKTIELSLPHPVQTYQEESPGFKLYKDRLATMFILENLDHGYDDVKVNYEERIKKEIDKYFEDAQKRNAIPLTKDQTYNELYNAMFNVPLPNNASIAEEVEEIKTKCEIDKWFETLPLRAVSSVGEVLARDQITAMLGKQIHRMEKYEQSPDDKIHKEITKWLSKLPLLPGQENNVDEFARILIQRLKLTLRNRKYTSPNENVYIDKFIDYKNKLKGKGILSSSPTAGPSSENKVWPCPASPTCCQISPPLSLKQADIIMNIVENWCQQLPLPSNTHEERVNTQVVKDNLIIKIIKKISELNVNTETLNNDLLYDTLLDDELENLLSTLPTSYEFKQSKKLRKNLLKDAIKSVIPLIQKEKAKYEYKQELQNMVDTFLKEPKNVTPKIRALYISIKDDIIDNFILYNYHKNDDEGRLYKMMVNVAVEKYFTNVCQNDVMLHSPLMVGNHLLCEMAKVPVPSEAAILEEIREIRMKLEITEFFDDHSICNRNDKLLLRNQIISTLAKRLSELKTASNTSENFNKMKNEIVKFLRKLDEIVEQEKIDSLVQTLLNLPDIESPGVSESIYERPLPFTDDDQRHINKCFQTPTEHQRFPTHYDNSNQKSEEDGPWMSLLSVTNAYDANYNKDNITQLERNNSGEMQRSQFNGQYSGANNSTRESKTNYSDFKRGVVLTSSVTKVQESNNEKYFTLQPNQKTRCNSSCMSKGVEVDQPINISSIASGQVAKPFTPYLQGHPKLFPKLSDQGSSFVQDINMQQSNSADNPYGVANDQPSIPPFNIFNSPIRPSLGPSYQQNMSEQRQALPDIENQFSSSTSDNRVTQSSPYIQNQSTKNENLRQSKEKIRHHLVPQPVSQQIPQQLPQKIMQNVPTLAQSNTKSKESYSSDGSTHTVLKSPGRKETTKQDKSQFSSPTSDSEEKDRFPNLSSSITLTKTSKSSAPSRKREPCLLVTPSQSSSSTPSFSPRKQSESINVPCCKRRPSIITFNPSDILSESKSSVQYTQTEAMKRSTDLTSDKEDEIKTCKCAKRKRLCRSEIPICHAHKKKRCKFCEIPKSFYCKMPPCRYPGYYYY